MSVSATAYGARGGTTVKLSGENVTDSLGPTATAGVRLTSSGTVEKNEHGSWSQIDSATDWIIPNAAASGTYSVKATLISQTGPGTRTGTLGSWLALSSTQSWTISRGTTGLSTWNLTLEISNDGGTTVIASGTYNLSVDPP